MMRRLAVIVLLLVPVAVARGGDVPVVSIPATAQVKSGRLLKIAATTNCKSLKWINYDPDNTDLIPSESGMSAIFSAPADGTYRVGVYGASADTPTDIAVCVVTVGKPPGPGPGPGPTDDLTKAIQAAYAQETDSQKASQLAYLALIYQGASKIVAAGDKTYGALFTRLSGAIHNPDVGIPKGSLPLVSKAIGAYLNSQLGTDPNAAVDATKANAAFSSVGAALKAVVVKARGK